MAAVLGPHLFRRHLADALGCRAELLDDQVKLGDVFADALDAVTVELALADLGYLDVDDQIESLSVGELYQAYVVATALLPLHNEVRARQSRTSSSSSRWLTTRVDPPGGIDTP